MRVRDGHLPDRNVRGDRGQELAERQRDDKLKVVPPRDVHVLPDAPQVEERPTVQRDAGQLDHGHRHRVRELAQDPLSDDVVTAGHDVPQDAQEPDGQHLAGCRPVRHFCGLEREFLLTQEVAPRAKTPFFGDVDFKRSSYPLNDT